MRAVHPSTRRVRPLEAPVGSVEGVQLVVGRPKVHKPPSSTTTGELLTLTPQIPAQGLAKIDRGRRGNYQQKTIRVVIHLLERLGMLLWGCPCLPAPPHPQATPWRLWRLDAPSPPWGATNLRRPIRSAAPTAVANNMSPAATCPRPPHPTAHKRRRLEGEAGRLPLPPDQVP